MNWKCNSLQQGEAANVLLVVLLLLFLELCVCISATHKPTQLVHIAHSCIELRWNHSDSQYLWIFPAPPPEFQISGTACTYLTQNQADLRICGYILSDKYTTLKAIDAYFNTTRTCGSARSTLSIEYAENAEPQLFNSNVYIPSELNMRFYSSFQSNMMYGWQLSSYRTVGRALLTIISLQIGIFNYDEVQSISPPILNITNFYFIFWRSYWSLDASRFWTVTPYSVDSCSVPVLCSCRSWCSISSCQWSWSHFPRSKHITRWIFTP